MFAFISYDPLVQIHIGPLSISPHGIGIAVGILVGMQVMLWRAKPRGITPEVVYDITWRAVVGAIVGARLFYVVNHAGEYISDPLAVLRVWEGGLTLLGGVVGAMLLILPYLRREKLPYWRVMDAGIPGLAAGIAIGRIGDLVIADHLGKATSFFLGYTCPVAPTGSPCVAPVGGAVHMTALYDLIAILAILGLLVWVDRRRHYDGFLTLLFCVTYGFARFLEGFARTDVTHGTGLNGSQWGALAFLGVSAVLLVVQSRSPRPRLAGLGGDQPQQPQQLDQPGQSQEPQQPDQPVEADVSAAVATGCSEHNAD